MSIARKFVIRAGMAAGFYGWWVRPRLMYWGATDEEVAGPYPGADLVPEGKRSGTMAVTIEASPKQVWPWLVQMGWDRGGWYSWDLLDNAGRPSATEVHPEWQDVAVGDQLSFWALGRRMDAYRVGVLEPDRFLGLYGLTDLRGRWLDPKAPRPASYMEAIWGFLLSELPGGRTRLVVSGYQTFRPSWIERFAADWLLLPVSWIMQARMLAVLKRNIARATPEQPHTATVSQNGSIQSEDLSRTA
jgi:proline iminopeptidase